jgi:hypothetical protein
MLYGGQDSKKASEVYGDQCQPVPTKRLLPRRHPFNFDILQADNKSSKYPTNSLLRFSYSIVVVPGTRHTHRFLIPESYHEVIRKVPEPR